MKYQIWIDNGDNGPSYWADLGSAYDYAICKMDGYIVRKIRG